MPYRTDIIYRFDGTFDGVLCCVFESYVKKEIPSEIITALDEQTSLFPIKEITTDNAKAERIRYAFPLKASNYAYEYAQKAFLSCYPQKELLILKFIYLGFKFGKTVMNMLADDTVNTMFKIVNNVNREAHFYREFIRFSSYNNVLVSVIEPKNIILPIISSHFTDRLRNEAFMIFDKSHNMALTYYNYKAEIIPVDELSLPSADSTEKNYRNLWKAFYNTIAIEERYNPKCRMNMMPKRYWKHMTEFAELYNEQDNDIQELNDTSFNKIEKQY